MPTSSPQIWPWSDTLHRRDGPNLSRVKQRETINAFINCVFQKLSTYMFNNMLGVCHKASCWNPTHSPWCQWLFGWVVMTSIAYNLIEQYGGKLKEVYVAWSKDLLRKCWNSYNYCRLTEPTGMHVILIFYRSFTWWYWQRDYDAMMSISLNLILSWRYLLTRTFFVTFFGISSNYDNATIWGCYISFL